MDRKIQVPISKEDAKSLRAGDYVYLTGTIYTARDAAHKRMQEALDADAYRSTIKGAYPWGSNMTIANNGMLYLMMEQLGTKMKQ